MMKSLKDLIGPIRTTKPERKQQAKRFKQREIESKLLNVKFGPQKSILAKYRQGLIPKSRINHMPIKMVTPIISDDINVFKKNPNYLHPGKGKAMGKELI